MRDLVDDVVLQDQLHLFKCPIPTLFERKVREFYYNIEFLENKSVNTKVQEVKIHLEEEYQEIFYECLGMVLLQLRSPLSQPELGPRCELEIRNSEGIPIKPLSIL